MIKLDINKKLDGTLGEMVLELSYTIPKGQLLTIYGESGAGKTSTLRMISGLLKPDQGMIQVDNTVWFDKNRKINLPPQKRNVGFVFQDYALFPNMTVKKNLTFASKNKKNLTYVTDIIDLMELGDLQNKTPINLSGGQQQRVALARALVQQPQILLLDEPLSALDSKIRFKLQDYLLKIHKEFNLTTILISHDIAEIIKLSDWVLILKEGKIINQGNPSQIFINKNISGKFRFTGDVLKIEAQETLYIVTVLIQSNVVEIVAQASEILGLNIGDKVMVASETFDPIIYKINRQ